MTVGESPTFWTLAIGGVTENLKPVLLFSNGSAGPTTVPSPLASPTGALLEAALRPEADLEREARVGAAEILAVGSLPQSSAYRNLAVLEACGVVHRVAGTDELARFERAEDLTEHTRLVLDASIS